MVRVHSQKLNSQLSNTPISPSSCHSLLLQLGQFHPCVGEILHVVGAISVVMETVVLMTVKEEYSVVFIAKWVWFARHDHEARAELAQPRAHRLI